MDGYIARWQTGLGWLTLISNITGFKPRHFQEVCAHHDPRLWAESCVLRGQRAPCSDARGLHCFLRFVGWLWCNRNWGGEGGLEDQDRSVDTQHTREKKKDRCGRSVWG